MGIEHIEELTTKAIANLRKDTSISNLLDEGRLKMVVGDGRQGHLEMAPYDAIHVGAAAPEIPPAVRNSIIFQSRALGPVSI